MLSIRLIILALVFKESRCALRIIGGRDAEPSEFPYVVRLEIQEAITRNLVHNYTYHHTCTCTALTHNWTLSAGHCAVPLDEPSQKYVIRYGSVHAMTGTKDTFSDVLSVLFHPAFQMNDFVLVNDVCLFRTQPIQLAQYGKVSAIDYAALSGLKLTAVGFGLVQYADDPYDVASTLELLKPLQVLDVIVVKCAEDARDMFPLICVAAKCGQRQTLCGGDSGGPLLHASGLVGVNTFTFNDCHTDGKSRSHLKKNVAGGITAISPSIEWIQREIRRNP